MTIYTVTLNPALDRELTVPALRFDSVLRAQSWRVDLGGKGFNVARMLHALGIESIALGLVGGKSGEQVRDGLESLGIPTDFVWVAGETRTNISIVTEPASHYLKVNEPGPTITAVAHHTLHQKIRTLAQPGDWWVIAGSLPPGLPADSYAPLIHTIQAAGAHVILDSSGSALRHACRAHPFLVKPNDTELQALTGLPVRTVTEIMSAARAVQAQGVPHLLVSLGAAGVLLLAEGQVWQASSPPITERNPIGAGDALVGGLAYGLSQGLSLVDALPWGVACGAATASMPGTAVGTRSLIETLRPQVQITPLPH